MSILKKAPEGSEVLDLGAARVARAEARAAAGKGSSFIKLTVGYVEVKPEIPLAVADDLVNEKVRQGLAGLLADPEDIDALLGELTQNDVQDLAAFIMGASLGE
jgi:phage-related tail fiber protein